MKSSDLEKAGVSGFNSDDEDEASKKILPASTVVSRHDPNLMNALQVSIMRLRPNEELWKAHKRQLTDPWVGTGAERHEEMITESANGLIDKWINNNQVEFISEFARPLPQIVMANVIGFSNPDPPVPLRQIGPNPIQRILNKTYLDSIMPSGRINYEPSAGPLLSVSMEGVDCSDCGNCTIAGGKRKTKKRKTRRRKTRKH